VVPEDALLLVHYGNGDRRNSIVALFPTLYEFWTLDPWWYRKTRYCWCIMGMVIDGIVSLHYFRHLDFRSVVVPEDALLLVHYGNGDRRNSIVALFPTLYEFWTLNAWWYRKTRYSWFIMVMVIDGIVLVHYGNGDRRNSAGALWEW